MRREVNTASTRTMLLILSTGPLCRPLQFEEACIIEIAYACVSEMQVTKVVLLHSSTPGGQCVRACCGLIFGDYTANHMVQTLEDWAGKRAVCACVRACVRAYWGLECSAALEILIGWPTKQFRHAQQ